jgi:hypothetical protein
VRWRGRAQKIQESWTNALIPPESENDRTYAVALWPTWVATEAREAVTEELTRRWYMRRDDTGGFRSNPLWTYFDVAEAHQWLYLGDIERTWKLLRWFWEHQASDGLYTWWEDEGEGNTYLFWNTVRGWVKPPHVTPHYWTNAEMLLLQLEMLAYTEDFRDRPTLVIGGGVPRSWLEHPVRVAGINTNVGRVNWSWRAGKLHVVIYGSQRGVDLRVGPAFPAGTPVAVEYRAPAI